MKKRISKVTLFLVIVLLGGGVIFAAKQASDTNKNTDNKDKKVTADNLKTDLPGEKSNFWGFDPFFSGGSMGINGGPGFYFRFNPFSEMKRIREQMDRMFEEFDRFGMMPQIPQIPHGFITRHSSFSPQTDMSDDGKNYIIKMDIPGVDKENISLKVKSNYLIVSATRQEKRENKKNGKYIRVERYTGEYQRVLALPEKIDPNKVDAKYVNGVLTITIPKSKKYNTGVSIPIK